MILSWEDTCLNCPHKCDDMRLGTVFFKLDLFLCGILFRLGFSELEVSSALRIDCMPYFSVNCLSLTKFLYYVFLVVLILL